MKIYYIADPHFGHENSIHLNNRPFSNLDEMEQTLIANWNQKVSGNDTIYILGDLFFKNKKPFEWYLKQLKGRKHLIIGNHDGKLLKDPEINSYFESISHYQEIRDGYTRCILCHYPMLEWNGFFRGSLMIHGHTHQNLPAALEVYRELPGLLNAGVEINGYQPVTLEELIEFNKEYK